MSYATINTDLRPVNGLYFIETNKDIDRFSNKHVFYTVNHHTTSRLGVIERHEPLVVYRFSSVI